MHYRVLQRLVSFEHDHITMRLYAFRQAALTWEACNGGLLVVHSRTITRSASHGWPCNHWLGRVK
jgi:hypothetical protein